MSQRGDLLQNVNVCLILISTFILSVRLYSRVFMSKTPGWDDIFASIAWVCVIVQSSLEIRETQLGSGRDQDTLSPEEVAKFFTVLPTLEIWYLICIGFVRLAILTFIPRLDIEKKFRKVLWALGFIIVSITAICFMLKLFQYKHISDQWNGNISGQQNISMQVGVGFYWAHAIIGTAVDLALLLIPIYLVYSNMRFSVTTIKVILVFSVGVFALIAGIIRLVIILTISFVGNITYKAAFTCLWNDLEVHVGLWVGSFPAMQPVLRLLALKFGLLGSNLVGKLKVLIQRHGRSPRKSTSQEHLKDEPSITKSGNLQNGTSLNGVVKSFKILPVPSREVEEMV